MQKHKIKRGDTVQIIAGSGKSHIGKVISVKADKRKGIRVKVAGGNIVKKAVKPNPQLNQEGGIISMEAFMDISNVAIYNENTNKPDRVGYKFVDDKKVRIYKSTGEQIDKI